MKKLLVLALCLLTFNAYAQTGVFPAGTVWGNAGGSSAQPKATPWSSFVGTLPLTQYHFLIGNASNIGVDTALGGDCTYTSAYGIICNKTSGVTITNLATATAGTGLAVSGGSLNLQPSASGVIGGIRNFVAVAHQWIQSINNGTAVAVQPSFSDLSGNISVSQMNSGVSATSSTCWFGDGSWKTCGGFGTGFVDLTTYNNSAAKCDGTTDDSTAIKAWLLAIAANGASPGVGFIPPGKTCIFNGIIPVTNTTMIMAYGATLKAKVSATNNTCFCISNADQSSAGPSNVAIYGLTVDGNRAAQGASVQTVPFFIISAANVWLHDVQAINSNQNGDCINVSGNSSTGGLSRDIYINGFKINTCGRNGLAVVGVSRLHVAHGIISNAIAAPGHGIDLEPGNANELDQNVVLQDLYINGNGGSAIAVDPSTIANGVSASMAMNIIAVGNTGTDFTQFTVPATKAGFRFINANGSFAAPATDALP